MKNICFLLIALPVFSFAQNVGIGTSTPTENLEIRNPLRSTVKISSTNLSDTTQFILSNRTGAFGTDFLITSRQEQGLFFTSKSDLSANNNDSAMIIRPNGNIGLGVKFPSAKLQVNGNAIINNFNTLEFGNGITKEINAGKIGYRAFSTDALDIVGAGSTAVNRKIHFFNEGGATFDGPVNANSSIQLNGNPGTAGQVLTSNGAADPTWTDAAYGNTIRFSFDLQQTNSAWDEDSINFTTTNYNLNPAMVVRLATNNSRLQFNHSGLYHFSGSVALGFYNYLSSSTINFEAYLNFSINNKIFPISSGMATRIEGSSNNDFFKTIPFSFDMYISAGQTLNLRKYFYPYTSGYFYAASGYLSGYLISD